MIGRDSGAVVAIWNGIASDARDAFYDWHETEHMRERVSIPGFLRGRRYRAVSGSPEFFTRYDLAGPEILTGQDYRARLNAPTPWTLRTLPSFRDTARALSRNLLDHGQGAAAWLATIRLSGNRGEDTRAALLSAARATASADGLIRLLLLETDEEASNSGTSEKTLRAPDLAFPDWTALIEGRSADATERACRQFQDALDQHPHARELLRDIGLYLLEFDLAGTGRDVQP